MYFKVWISTSCNHEMNAGFESMLVLMIDVQYHSKNVDSLNLRLETQFTHLKARMIRVS